MSLSKKEKDGKLKRCKPGGEELKRLLESTRRRLEDANNATLHNETKLEQAYEAVLLCSKIALLASGYRVRQGEGHHYESIDTLRYTLAIENKRAKYFQALRVKRHKGLYDGFIAISESELKEAIREAGLLLTELISWLEINYSELYKNFD